MHNATAQALPNRVDTAFEERRCNDPCKSGYKSYEDRGVGMAYLVLKDIMEV